MGHVGLLDQFMFMSIRHWSPSRAKTFFSSSCCNETSEETANPNTQLLTFPASSEWQLQSFGPLLLLFYDDYDQINGTGNTHRDTGGLGATGCDMIGRESGNSAHHHIQQTAVYS
ncbi:hypothetical protein HCH54_007046 [Aspergillus fumigatus]